jgi:hypothetical protein
MLFHHGWWNGLEDFSRAGNRGLMRTLCQYAVISRVTVFDIESLTRSQATRQVGWSSLHQALLQETDCLKFRKRVGLAVNVCKLNGRWLSDLLNEADVTGFAECSCPVQVLIDIGAKAP